jgi:hypothetical protein
MKYLFCIVFLASCVTTEKPPASATDPANVSKLGDKIDTTEARAAAAVTVAVERADQPEVVKAEGKVALAYLPAPSEADIAFARERASKGDLEAYKTQIAYAKGLQAEVNKMWEKMESDNLRNLAEIKALNLRNEQLAKEVEKVKTDADRNFWTMLAGGMFVLGAVVCAFLSWKTGATLIFLSTVAGSIPVIQGSAYFLPIVLTAIGIALSFGLWVLWDKARDKVNESSSPSSPD